MWCRWPVGAVRVWRVSLLLDPVFFHFRTVRRTFARVTCPPCLRLMSLTTCVTTVESKTSDDKNTVFSWQLHHVSLPICAQILFCFSDVCSIVLNNSTSRASNCCGHEKLHPSVLGSLVLISLVNAYFFASSLLPRICTKQLHMCIVFTYLILYFIAFPMMAIS